MKNVLLYIPRLDQGGPDRVFAILGCSFRDCAHLNVQFLVHLPGGRYYERVISKGIKVHCINSRTRHPTIKALKAIKGINPDFVLATQDAIATAALAKRVGRLPFRLLSRPANHVSLNFHELGKKFSIKYAIAKQLYVWSLCNSESVICQSQDIFDDLMQLGLPPSKLHVIGNPIGDLPALTTLPKSEKTQFVAAGRLSEQKGFDLLIEAIAMLPPNIKHQSTFRIYGAGELRSLLEGLIQSKNLSETVSLQGHAKSADDFLKDADYLISSSRYEGFPNVILEALSRGIPVIATNCPGGTKALVINDQTGWLSSTCPTDLACTIQKAMTSKRPEPARLQDFVLEHFGTHAIVDRYVQLFKKYPS